MICICIHIYYLVNKLSLSYLSDVRATYISESFTDKMAVKTDWHR